ncbi:glycogen debranching N-terminal domain-containing protein [Arthrobacter sp. H14-L1]|uniref:glycogen debranching N-terminal domain-containing protein n=1 Tax=Arthrobacter sp. H14-L1 TaxID=2996697 RepID=UPI0022714B40|nr:glycogen debranching N-terminal domain-containing protein [Arthrobacter sp. H14-L1]MCY0904548.1 amylo-alpha-1,6-glucosidase [Arthrobacter sp. H14-L1]
MPESTAHNGTGPPSRQPLLHRLTAAVAAPYQLWLGDDGQLRTSGAQGAYLGDTRILSCALLTVDGREPEAVSVHVRPAVGGQLIEARFIFRGAGSTVLAPPCQLTRSLLVTPQGVGESICIESALRTALTVHLGLELAADLAGMDAVRGGAITAPLMPRIAAATYRWDTSDGVESTLVLNTPAARAGAATSTAADNASAVVVHSVTLEPHGTAKFGWQLTGTDPLCPVSAAPAWQEPKLTADTNPRLAALAAQSASDVAGLRLTLRGLSGKHHHVAGEPSATFLAAGAPWYFTLFGRDSLWAARLLLSRDLSLAVGTLRTLAAFQGSTSDPATAEQPGKIPHELRRDSFSIPSENQGKGLYLPPLYYGTVDATPLWVCLLHEAWQAGMAHEEVESLLDSCEAALEWMVEYGDSDGDGFLEYIDPTGKGLANQGWKDSAEAIRWPDGTLASGPIALCEVQAYAYEAAMGGSALLTAFGRSASRWRAWGTDLQGRFRDKFWCEDLSGRFPAIALDAQKRPVSSAASNMGHLLGTGLLNGGESQAVAERLTAPDLFTGFGIRTLSQTNACYWPLSYHCGSVWSHDTAIIVAGLLKDGHTNAAHRIASGLLDAAEAFHYRLPELFGGYSRSQAPAPVPYPMSCFPQAWAAAAAVPILDTLA